MPYGFLDTLSTPSVKAAQAANDSAHLWSDFRGHRTFDRLTEDEIALIGERDSFYLASTGENGWPYIQHRGGPPGFLRVLDDKTLAFADFRGNRQYISLGNLAANDRVALILMDYPRRQRLKILAHAQVRDLKDDPELAARLAMPHYKAKVERAIVLHLEAFDWNCSQHITRRFTETEVTEALAPIQRRIEQLEAENKALHQRLEQTALSGT
ncbi:MAG TPA: pyridoxamine 5'-phosphate oxidase family protein [Steroidobacteraceae bacterium]